jgi:hypothetical protein
VRILLEIGLLLALPGIAGKAAIRPDGPNGGVADSLDEAKAAFRAAGERPPNGAPGREPVSVRFFGKKRTRNARFESISVGDPERRFMTVN